MLLDKIKERIPEECGSLIFVADAKSCGLLYMNKEMKAKLGIEPADDSYIGRKCSEILQEITHSCENCKSCGACDTKRFTHALYHNEDHDEYFQIRWKSMEVDGHTLYLEIADEVTKQIKQQKDALHQLERERVLIRCAKTLGLELEVKDAINRLFEIIGQYYKAGRTYLFEIDYEAKTTSNTYEWVKPGTTAEIDNLQNVPIESIKPFLDMFEDKGMFYITDLDADISKDTLTYQILQAQGIHGLLAVPVVKDEEVVGFLGVDDPKDNMKEFDLLTSVLYFIQNDLEKRRVMEQLEKLSYEDTLTGLYNRNRYNEVRKAYKKKAPDKLGIIYMDLNGLKQANDTFGHDYGDKLIRKTAKILAKVVGKDAYRIGGDEFVAICPGIELEDLEKKTQELRHRAEKDEIKVSIGTSWRDENVHIKEQLYEADQRMYEEKKVYYKQIRKEKL